MSASTPTLDEVITAGSRAASNLAKQQFVLRIMRLEALLYKAYAEQLTVPGEGMASDILKHMCSTPTTAYRIGTAINNDKKDAAIACIRTAGSTACPTDAAEARL